MRTKLKAGYLSLTLVILFACNTKDGEPNANADSAVARQSAQAEQIAPGDTIYRDDEFVLLRVSRPLKTMSTVGDTISDAEAHKYINDYRYRLAENDSRYVGLSYHGLFNHLSEERKKLEGIDLSPISDKQVGVRIYFVEKDGKKSTMLAMTYKNQAVWNNKIAKALGLVGNEQFKAYNDGQICPYMCGDDDKDRVLAPL